MKDPGWGRSGDQTLVLRPSIESLTVQLFADGADESTIRRLAGDDRIAGFTTNPTLMRKAGVTNYESFARRVIRLVGQRPISLEVFADDFAQMAAQAREIASWGDNVFVKIPITDTRGTSSMELVRRLASERLKLNITAVLTLDQLDAALAALPTDVPAFVSIFAGRIADTGRDPVPLMRAAVGRSTTRSNVSLIWASPRELLNIFQADAVGCHAITLSEELLAKLQLVGRDLTTYSRDTVRMFHEDGQRAGYTVRPKASAR